MIILYFVSEFEKIRLGLSGNITALRYTFINSHEINDEVRILDLPVPSAFLDNIRSWNKAYARWVADIQLRVEWCYRYKIDFEPPPGVTFVGSVYNGDSVIGQIMACNDTFICCFRGTASYDELRKDLDYPQVSVDFFPPPIKVHSGFASIYGILRQSFLSQFKALGYKKALVIGHSLGAAICALGGLDLSTNTDAREVAVYQFGGPRVGNIEFGRYYDTRINMTSYGLINTQDIVPFLPLTIFPNFDDPPNPYYYYEFLGIPKIFSIQNFSWLSNHLLPCYIKYINSL